MERRKIVEIYIEEDIENEKIYFDVERVEDSKVANATMKMLLNTFSKFKGNDVDVTYEGRED